jgi:hypothetical protein
LRRSHLECPAQRRLPVDDSHCHRFLVALAHTNALQPREVVLLCAVSDLSLEGLAR